MFVSPTKGKLTLPEVIHDIIMYMCEDKRSHYRLIVGTDSQVNAPLRVSHNHPGARSVDFVSALAVHRVGRGGRYFWRRAHREYSSPLALKARMFTEANLSIELAIEFLALLQQSLADALLEFEPQVEVHIDIGQNGPTREIIKELVGLVRNNGFEARIKPEAYVASTVADKHA